MSVQGNANWQFYEHTGMSYCGGTVKVHPCTGTVDLYRPYGP